MKYCIWKSNYIKIINNNNCNKNKNEFNKLLLTYDLIM